MSDSPAKAFLRSKVDKSLPEATKFIRMLADDPLIAVALFMATVELKAGRLPDKPVLDLVFKCVQTCFTLSGSSLLKEKPRE